MQFCLAILTVALVGSASSQGWGPRFGPSSSYYNGGMMGPMGPPPPHPPPPPMIDLSSLLDFSGIVNNMIKPVVDSVQSLADDMLRDAQNLSSRFDDQTSDLVKQQVEKVSSTLTSIAGTLQSMAEEPANARALSTNLMSQIFNLLPQLSTITNENLSVNTLLPDTTKAITNLVSNVSKMMETVAVAVDIMKQK